MQAIETIEELKALYGEVGQRSFDKVVRRMTPAYAAWIGAARFVVISTVGPEGTDGSPRGDEGPVARIEGDRMLLLPDWRGNNRIDTLRNLVRDPRVSLMFMVPGSNNVVRVNGRAMVTAEEGLRASFEKRGKRPATVIAVELEEMYFQCAKAVMRADLWGAARPDVPSAGAFVREQQADFDAESYDADYPEYAKARMW